MYGCKSIHCPAYVTKVSFIGVSNITNTINRAGGVNRDVKTNTLTTNKRTDNNEKIELDCCGFEPG